MLDKWGKALLAVLAPMLVLGIRLFTGDHSISLAEGAQIVIAGTGPALVWLVPIVPQRPAIKTSIMLVSTLATIGTVAFLDGFDINDVSLMIGELVVFFGVSRAPADSEKVTGAAVGWGSDSLIKSTLIPRSGVFRE